MLNNQTRRVINQPVSFISFINFNSQKGLIFYSVLMILLDLIWLTCILCSNTITFVIALTVIPFLYFFIGKHHLKQKDDKKHLKIHKALLALLVSSIVLFFTVAIFSYLIGTSVIIIGCILISFNLLISYALFANALDGDKVVDFVMGIFIKLS